MIVQMIRFLATAGTGREQALREYPDFTPGRAAAWAGATHARRGEGLKKEGARGARSRAQDSARLHLKGEYE